MDSGFQKMMLLTAIAGFVLACVFFAMTPVEASHPDDVPGPLPTLIHVAADPCGTPSFPEGTLFYNATAQVPCYCNGTDDLKISNDAACF
jgi:hypothetical protein